MLRIRRGGGYCVSWDIDRLDSSRPYEWGNLALSCFVCNMAKGDQLTAAEARVVGQAIRGVWRARLSERPAAENVLPPVRRAPRQAKAAARSRASRD